MASQSAKKKTDKKCMLSLAGLDIEEKDNVLSYLASVVDDRALFRPWTLSMCSNPSKELGNKLDAATTILAEERDLPFDEAKKILLDFLENKILEDEGILSNCD